MNTFDHDEFFSLVRVHAQLKQKTIRALDRGRKVEARKLSDKAETVRREVNTFVDGAISIQEGLTALPEINTEEQSPSYLPPDLVLRKCNTLPSKQGKFAYVTLTRDRVHGNNQLRTLLPSAISSFPPQRNRDTELATDSRSQIDFTRKLICSGRKDPNDEPLFTSSHYTILYSDAFWRELFQWLAMRDRFRDAIESFRRVPYTTPLLSENTRQMVLNELVLQWTPVQLAWRKFVELHRQSMTEHYSIVWSLAVGLQHQYSTAEEASKKRRKMEKELELIPERQQAILDKAKKRFVRQLKTRTDQFNLELREEENLRSNEIQILQDCAHPDIEELITLVAEISGRASPIHDEETQSLLDEIDKAERTNRSLRMRLQKKLERRQQNEAMNTKLDAALNLISPATVDPTRQPENVIQGDFGND